MSKKLTYTKSQIRTEIKEIQTLDKAFHICITEYDLREQITLKMADKLELMIRCIISERNLSDWVVEELEEVIDDMNSHIKEEDYEKSIFFDEVYELCAVIRSALLQLNVYLDLGMNI